MFRLAIPLALAATLAVGCSPGTAASEATAPFARADLRMADGTAAGTVRATEVAGALRIDLTVRGISPGRHGAHVHMVGKCDAPDFMTAGGHWNPTGAQHGLDNPQGAHAGDMPNVDVAADGTGTLSFNLRSGTRDGLLDGDGAAFVVHASADDQRTDPSGNSGGRIACGVFAAR